jgi:hypothetical protein
LYQWIEFIFSQMEDHLMNVPKSIKYSSGWVGAAAAARVAGQEEDNVPLPESSSTGAPGRSPDGVDDAGVDDDDSEEEPVITSVWDFEKVEKTGEHKSTGAWKCLWCNKCFKGWNATKALRHITKVVGKDIRPCKATIDKQYLLRYRSFANGKAETRDEKKKNEGLYAESIVRGQQSLSVVFENARERASTGGGKQPNSTTSTSTIEASTASQLTMAIADFIHSTGLSFSATQGVGFERILTLARGVRSDYTPPSRQSIGSSLLKMNYNRRQQK